MFICTCVYDAEVRSVKHFVGHRTDSGGAMQLRDAGHNPGRGMCTQTRMYAETGVDVQT